MGHAVNFTNGSSPSLSRMRSPFPRSSRMFETMAGILWKSDPTPSDNLNTLLIHSTSKMRSSLYNWQSLYKLSTYLGGAALETSRIIIPWYLVFWLIPYTNTFTGQKATFRTSVAMTMSARHIGMLLAICHIRSFDLNRIIMQSWEATKELELPEESMFPRVLVFPHL